MLTRIITAALLAILVLGSIVHLPPIWFALGSVVVVLLGLYEWQHLGGRAALGSGVVLLGLCGLSAYVPTLWLVASLTCTLFWVGQLGYLVVRGKFLIGTQRRAHPAYHAGLGLWLLFGAWSALVWLHQQSAIGTGLLLTCLLLVWVADGMAYFGGRACGKTPLAATISPGKTVAGAVIGFAAATVTTALCAHYILQFTAPRLWVLLGIGGVTAILSVVGDLFESQLKRQAAVKDSGRLLPGHGGVLDRIDGILAASPVFASLVYFLL